ncbi:MAG TPA: hypothetical protein VNF71_07050 [Acidimicrobiales bacterium]|nr:hypothetical protein [Acidimicrobiales bacterium]
MPTWGTNRRHPLIEYREERRVQPTELPANVQARQRAEEDRQRRSIEGQKELHARAEEARKQKAADRDFWTGLHAAILDAQRRAEGDRHGAFVAGDAEAAIAAQIRVNACRDLVEPLRQAAAHALGPQFSPHLTGRA